MQTKKHRTKQPMTSRRLLAILLAVSFMISLIPSMNFLQSRRLNAAAPENHKVLTGSTLTIVHRQPNGDLLKKKVEYLYTEDGTPVYCVKAASDAPTGGSLATSVLMDDNAKALLRKIQYIIDYVNPGLNSSFENYAVKQLLVWKLIYEYEGTLSAASQKYFHGVNLDACELDEGELTAQALRVVAKAQEIWAKYNSDGRPGNDEPGYFTPNYRAEIHDIKSDLSYDSSANKYYTTFKVVVRDTVTGYQQQDMTFTFDQIQNGSLYAKDSSGNYSIQVTTGTAYKSGTEFKFVGSWAQIGNGKGMKVSVNPVKSSVPSSRAMYGFFLDPNNEAKQTYVVAFDNTDKQYQGDGNGWKAPTTYKLTMDKVTSLSGSETPEKGAEFQVWSAAYASFDAAKADGLAWNAVSTETGAIVDVNTKASILAPNGTYTVKQTVAPTGTLTMSPNPQSITVSNDNAYKKFTDAVVTGSFEIHKKLETGADTYAGKAWADLVNEQGAQFQVWNTKYSSYDSAPADYRDLLTTDANGYAKSKNLPYGDYKVHQLPSSTTYEVADFTVEIRGGATQPEKNFNLTNKQYELKIQIRKVDERTGDIVPAAGIEFEVLDENKNVLKDWDGNSTFVTAADGTASLEKLGLKVGTYYVHELKAPTGFVLSDELVQFTATKGETFVGVGPEGNMKAVPFADASVSCELELIKTGDMLTSATEVDAGYNDLMGYEFGYSEVNLEGATYELYVVNDVFDFARDITLLDTTKYPAYEVSADGKTFTPYKMFDKDGDGVGDTAMKSGAYLGAYTTDSNGKIVVGGLALDTVTGTSNFKLVEVAAPNGFLIDSTPITYSFTDDRADQHITVISHSDSVNDKKQNLELTFEKVARDYKYDAKAKEYLPTDTGLAGAVFGIYASSDILAADGSVLVTADSLIEVVTSDDTGICVSKESTDYPLGYDYYVQEIEAPEGYVLNPDKYTISAMPIDNDNTTLKYTFSLDEAIVNERSRACIEISKIASDTHLPMENVVFDVYTSKGELVETIVTDKDGKAITSFAFPYGDEITLKETKTNEFYDLGCDEVLTINVPQTDLGKYGVQSIQKINYLMSQIQIVKLTNDGREQTMDGTVFQLWEKTESGDVMIAEEETDANGRLTFYAGEGKYYIKEVSVGKWTRFTVLKDTIDLDLGNDGKIYHYNVYDDATKSIVEKRSASSGDLLGHCGISVKDAAGNVLYFRYDAKFNGYFACDATDEGATQVCYTCDDPNSELYGVVQLYALDVGKYEIYEVEAPEGYNNDSQAVSIEVKNTGVLGVKRLFDTIKTNDAKLFLGYGICAFCGISFIACLALATVEFIDFFKKRRMTR